MIHCCRWTPAGEIRGVVQIVHGIAEYVERYTPFAEYLNARGILVVAEDHMGHGGSINNGGIQGYFHGGWEAAVNDTHTLMEMTMAEFPDVPYAVFGHSMGSFMTRTLLYRWPEEKLSAAVICGTGWQSKAALAVGRNVCGIVCRKYGEKTPVEALQKLVFGSYNNRVEHPQTPFDWLCRDRVQVQAYIDHPLCGFTASCGLLRDMLGGMAANQDPKNLAKMNRALPVYFIAGGDDPVGSYGEGVQKTADAFRKSGMEDVSCRIYPLCRHEILNEINKEEIFANTAQWLEEKMFDRK